MIIKKLFINGFGKFKEKEISFTDGLNVVYAPNESGKSTVAAFIRFILYGFPKKERNSQNNPLTLRQKYIPWYGDSAGGSMTLSNDGKEYSVERIYRKSGYTTSVHNLNTGAPVVLHREPGEEFLDLSYETYESTAFFNQSDFAQNGTEELESKLRNLASGAREDVSYDKASQKMKQLFTRIYSKRPSSVYGSLQERKEKLLSRKNELDELTSDKGKTDLLEDKRRKLELTEKEISVQREILEGLEKRKKEEFDDIQAEKLSTLSDLREKYDALEKSTENLSAEKINTTTIEFYKLNAEMSRYSNMLEEPKQKKGGIFILMAGLLVAAVSVLIYFLGFRIFALITGIAALAGIVTGVLLYISDSKKYELAKARHAAIKKKYDEVGGSLDDIYSLIESYGYDSAYAGDSLKKLNRMVSEKEKYIEEIEKYSKDTEALRFESEMHSDSDIIEAEEKLNALENTYNNLRVDIAEISSDLTKYNSYLEELGTVEDELNDIRLKTEKCLDDANCLGLAIRCLEEAHSELSELFSPFLNEKATEYFHMITGTGRSIIVDVSGNVKVLDNGNVRDVTSYSAGTQDAVHMAVRLASVELLYKDNMPALIFDDTFSNLDDGRIRQMLKMLGAIGTQTIYFTCRNPREYLNGIDCNIIKL